MALHHSQPGEVTRLAPLSNAATRTAALAKTSDFEAIQLVMRAEETIPAHRVDGAITLYCAAGHVEITGDSTIEMRAGDWVYLQPGTPHALRAIGDTCLLLTILFQNASHNN